MAVKCSGNITLTRVDDGKTGRGVKTAAISYQESNSGTSIPTGEWTAAIPVVKEGFYLWTRTIFTYTDDTKSDPIYSVGKMGNTGSPGTAGKGIKSTIISYQIGVSQTDIPTGAWSPTVLKTTTALPYLWTKTIIVYTDDTQSEPGYSVSSTLDSFEIGGRNLLLNSLKIWLDSSDYSGVVALIPGQVSVTGSGAFNAYTFFHSNFSVDLSDLLIPDEILTISADIKATNADEVYFGFGLHSEEDDAIVKSDEVKIESSGAWKRYSSSYRITAKDSLKTQFSVRLSSNKNNANALIEYKNFKFEKGKSTDWSPAPEDLEDSITDLNDSLNATNQNVGNLNNAVDSLEKDNETNKTDIKNNSDKIDQTDKKADSVTEAFNDFRQAYDNVFELTKNGLKINGVKKDDDGTVTVLDVSTLFQANRWSFISGFGDNAVEVAYISNQKLYIPIADITDKIIIGKHSLTSDNGDDFALVYEG